MFSGTLCAHNYVIGTTLSGVLDPPLLILHFVRHASLSVEEVVVYVIIIHPLIKSTDQKLALRKC